MAVTGSSKKKHYKNYNRSKKLKTENEHGV